MLILKQVFDMYVEDTISDEQAHRIVEPVIRMIRAGEFEKPRPVIWLLKPVISGLGVGALIILTALT